MTSPVRTRRVKEKQLFLCFLLSACSASSQVSNIGNSVDLLVHIRGHLCSSQWGWRHLGTEQCEQLQYSHYCSSPLSYERRYESFWHLQPLVLSVCVLRQAPYQLPIMWMCTVPICVYLCVRSLLSGWYVVVHMLNVSGGTCRRPGFSSALSSPRPGAAEWVRLAQKTSFLRGKWSMHNLDQWYRLPLLLPPASSFSSPLGCLITPRWLLP